MPKPLHTRLLTSLVSLLFGLFLGGQTAAKDLNTYIFGNSLIHHLSESNQTSTPYWVHHIATAAGHGFRVDGHWGFLRDFSAILPPAPNWSFRGVRNVWNSDRRPFGDAPFDTIIINPANFIQSTAPDQMGEWQNPSNNTPLDDTLAVFDWVIAQGISPKFYLYEGWPEMDGLIAGNASRRKFSKYYKSIKSDYHDWYADWAALLHNARPTYDITLIPVASLLADLLRDGPLGDIPPDALFLDDAPHGTATLYFLAGAITYSALYDAPLPPDLTLPDTLHPLVRNNLQWINETVQNRLQSNHATSAPLALENRAVVSSVGPTTPAITGLGVPNPSLAMGLNGIADWSTQHPFIDLMKTARPWVGHLPGQWGGWNTQDLENNGFLDSDGWPIAIPEALVSVETFILTDQPEATKSAAGWYRLTYEGSGEIRLTGRAKKMRQSDGEIRFHFTPGDGPVGISILQTDPDDDADYIRDIHVVRDDHIALFEVGALFNPDWINHIQDLRALRFMDWMFTNGSLTSHWKDRATTSDYTYIRRGVPLEVMIALANQIGADAWFNMPHMADDTYMRAFAQTVHDTLDPALGAYVEYSNELWNFTFPQAHWVAAQANTRWGKDAPQDAWLQFYGLRAAEMAHIWAGVFADTPDRLTRVIATHTGWPGLEEALLQAPLYRAENPANTAPVTAFDAYAVTGYFGLELGEQENAPEVLGWIEKSRAKAVAAGEALGYSRVKLRLYVEENLYTDAIAPAIERIKSGSLNEYLTEMLPYQAAVAQANNLEMIMYEGGTHVVGLGALSGNDDLTGFFNMLNYTSEMASLYNDLLTGWRAAGGTLFNAFVDVSEPSQYGSWGSLRHLDDQNPRHDTLMTYNTDTPAWWETRAEATFLHGAIITGTGSPDTMTGTHKRDIFIARAGDDRITSHGHGDLIHGGKGVDTVVLSGAMIDYTFARNGGRLIATNAATTVQMFAVETLEFTSGTPRTISISDIP